MAETSNLSDLDKLGKLLPYLIHHNQEHSEELREWEARVVKAGVSGVAEELRAVVSLSDKIVVHLTSAQNKLAAAQ